MDSVRTLEVAPGERVAFRTESHDLECARGSGELRLREHRLLGSARERVVPLQSLVDLTLHWSEDDWRASLLTFKRAFEIWRRSESKVGEKELDAAFPPAKNLALTFVEQRADGRHESRVPIPFSELDRPEKLVELGLTLGNVVGLPYFGVFEIPGVPPEVRASRDPGEGLRPIAEHEDGLADPEELAEEVSVAVDARSVPAFAAGDLAADHEVEEWDPGQRIVLRRRGSAASLALAPLPLFFLAGPALGVSRYLRDRPMGWFTIAIVTLLGAMLGTACTMLLLRSLPRSSVFDWQLRELRIRTLFRRRRIDFDDVDGVRLGIESQTTHSDGGISRTSYYGELAIETRRGRELVKILETRTAGSVEAVRKQIYPLANELAEALGVELSEAR